MEEKNDAVLKYFDKNYLTPLLGKGTAHDELLQGLELSLNQHDETVDVLNMPINWKALQKAGRKEGTGDIKLILQGEGIVTYRDMVENDYFGEKMEERDAELREFGPQRRLGNSPGSDYWHHVKLRNVIISHLTSLGVDNPFNDDSL